MQIIEGDLLDVVEGIIGHQVNCQRVANAGLARLIRNKYEGWIDNFNQTKPELGKVGIFICNPKLVVANLYGQEFYGTGLQTDYVALEKALRTLEELGKYYDLPIYLPYGIGCGLAGGDWQIVNTSIEICCPSATIVRLPQK